ncbi:helicase RepA family protein [Aeromonas rivipollensis]|uniref:helicase RepA family protein n=1 Tax=Aeromonas rivipollensis TaxID=948519 RepID=UPI0038CF6144
MTTVRKIVPTKFRDLTNKKVVVIHTGSFAQYDPESRKVWQRAHNLAITETNPIDPELEPEQTLFVSEKQCSEGGKFGQMADPDITERVIIQGALDFPKLGRLCDELRKQAPGVEIYRGVEGENATPWTSLTKTLATMAAVKAGHTVTNFPLISGYEGFDTKHDYLIKGLLPLNSTCAINGPSATYKSFIAISMGCHVATGTAWDGRNVEKGAVLYIVGEGGVGVPRRIRAWADQYNNSRDVPNFYRIPMPVFMADELQVAELEIAANQIKEATGLPMRLIVVDTVARCFGAGDENRAADMGAFIKGCDLIKAKTGATVLMIHHTGKNEDNGPRGSSAFRAALDVELLVKREGGQRQAVTLTCTKMKDDEEPPKRAYDLKTRTVYHDDVGDEVTSLVLIDTGREPVEPGELGDVGNLTSNHVAMYQTIRALCERLDGTAPWGLVIEHMKEAKTWDPRKGTRWRDKLASDGVIIWDAINNAVSMPTKPE